MALMITDTRRGFRPGMPGPAARARGLLAEGGLVRPRRSSTWL